MDASTTSVSDSSISRCHAELERAKDEIRRLNDEISHLKSQLENQTGYLRDELRTELQFKKLIGNSPGLRQVRKAIDQVAATESTVLITGETGTGKELIARAVHEQSPRRKKLLVKVNCAALPAGVIASELFGHEAGAFTGANKQRIGRFELAHEGTLFLDEIAEIPADIQVLLLRALQERTIERVGGNEPIKVNVRIIAATNQDLTKVVRDGCFRSDLFYRLNVFPIAVPPLRNRAEDIPLLLHHFRVQLNRRMNKQIQTIDEESMRLAQQYTWPGNIRELENLVERAMIIAGGDMLILDRAWFQQTRHDSSSSLADMERQAIVDALHQCSRKVYGPNGAAALLGLKPTTLYGKMRKFGIKKTE